MAKLPGSLWVEDVELHYVDSFNREWYMPGIYVKLVTGKPGSIWVDSTNAQLHFINSAGNAVYKIEAQLDGIIPINAIPGSLWVDSSDSRLRWVAFFDPSKYKVQAHQDVAGGSIHTDSHVDSAHTDTAHSDAAHQDAHTDNPHGDGHGDVPHQDSHQDIHADEHADFGFGDAFNDHNDCTRLQFWDIAPDPDRTEAHLDCRSTPRGLTHQDQTHYHEDNSVGHQDYQMPAHVDYIQHIDEPHNDSHNDAHYDQAHQDSPPQTGHGDFNDAKLHTDVAHLDSAHTDVAHTDTHADAHVDTPHYDQPILVGP